MGAIIKAVATSEGRSLSSFKKAGSEAVKYCLEKSVLGPAGLGMLINTGVYPDNHIQEPAFASLLQGNQPDVHYTSLEETFSFDLHSGGGGVIAAMSILNGFIESGKIEYGMVVAGDAESLKQQSSKYNFTGHAGALLLGKGANNQGFINFHQDTYVRYLDHYDSYTNYIDNRLHLVIRQKDKYLDQCVQCAEESVKKFFDGTMMKASEVDLFIASQSPAGFASALAELYGRNKVMVLRSEEKLYSAGILLALEKAQLQLQYSTARKIMFISVGPGITVNLAHYLNPI